jgi:hypothetical protein
MHNDVSGMREIQNDLFNKKANLKANAKNIYDGMYM